MTEKKQLLDVFNEVTYRVAGNGKRTVQQLKDAFEQVDGDLASDNYGAMPVIEDFQKKMAKYLGKKSAVFFPSGTMAQQIALRIWCDRKGVKRVAYHPLSHLEIHEANALKELHGIDAVLLADKHRIVTLEDVQNMPEDVACVLYEVPQREIGGQVPSFEELEAISAYCREKGIKFHLDGARLFEVLPYYQKTAEEVCALFDSVYVSFYKGIGGIAGAILAGDISFSAESKVWKRRHGGDLISLYPYIISSDYYFEMRVHKMEEYYAHAKELAHFYNQCEGVSTRPEVPVSNMFHVHFQLPKEQVEPILVEIYEQTGIGLTAYLRDVNEDSCYYEVSLGDLYANVPKDGLQTVFQLLDEKMKEALAK